MTHTLLKFSSCWVRYVLLVFSLSFLCSPAFSACSCSAASPPGLILPFKVGNFAPETHASPSFRSLLLSSVTYLPPVFQNTDTSVLGQPPYQEPSASSAPTHFLPSSAALWIQKLRHVFKFQSSAQRAHLLSPQPAYFKQIFTVRMPCFLILFNIII